MNRYRISTRAVLNYMRHSLTVKMIFLLIAVLLPTTFSLIYNTLLARQTLVEQARSTYRNLLANYATQTTAQMDAASLFLTNELYYDDNVRIVSGSSDAADIQYAYQDLMADQADFLASSDDFDGVFVSILQQGGFRALVSSSSYTHSSLSQQAIRQILYQYPDIPNSGWQIVTLGITDYLVYIAASDDGNIRAGAYLKISRLLSTFDIGDTADAALMILSPDALAQENINLASGHILISTALEDDLVLAQTFSASAIEQALPIMTRYSYVSLGILLLLFVLFLLLLYHLVLMPVYRLADFMHKVEGGDMDARMEVASLTSEFQLLNSSVNRMLDNIRHLTVDVFEEQMKVQKAQLRNLQLQIKPHFLINSLNMIYNLIETHQDSTALKLIRYSINYFRYMTRVDEDLVPLNEEIDHITSYLEIQSLRYKNMFTYEITPDPMVEDMLVPPMMLQNFVENSIKYALNTTTGAATSASSGAGSPLVIKVSVHSYEKDYYPFANIIVSDNGSGYPEEMLPLLNAGKNIEKTDGVHIGLRNTTQRLSILFGDQAQWEYKNAGGAMVTITLPVRFAEE